MGIHVVHRPDLQSLGTLIRMCALEKPNDQQMIPLSLYFLVLLRNTFSRDWSSRYGLEVLKVALIWGLRGEPPSHKRGGLMSLGLSDMLTTGWSRVCRTIYIWSWALAQTSIFFKHNTEKNINWIIVELWWFFCCCFQGIKARIMLAVLNSNKSLK